MVAFDLTTVVHDGIIHVAPSLNGRQVRVVVLTDDVPETAVARRATLERMFASRCSVEKFVPMTRDEANSRP